MYVLLRHCGDYIRLYNVLSLKKKVLISSKEYYVLRIKM